MLDHRIKTFIAVAKFMNYTKASRWLNITQPAVSQHIKHLEDYYDVQLFVKMGKRIELTEEGEILLESALKLENLVKSTEKKIHNNKGMSRKYDLGATMTIGEYVIPEVLGRYKIDYPMTDVRLLVHNTERIIEQLNAETLDLGLVEGDFNREIPHRLLREDELVFAVSATHPLSHRDSITLEEVLEEKLILREKGSGTRKTFETALVQRGRKAEEMNIFMEVSSITAIKSMVEQNLGHTVIGKASLKKELASGTIKILPIEGVTMKREFNFVYRHNSPMSFVENFMAFCLDSI